MTSLVDDSGNVVQRMIYEPYGPVLDLTWYWSYAGENLSGTSYDWSYGYQGGRWDSSLWRFGLRDLQFSGQGVAHWMEPDPTGAMYINGADLYQFELSNPVASVDPSGLQGQDPFAFVDQWAANNPLYGHGYNAGAANPQANWNNNLGYYKGLAQGAARRQAERMAPLGSGAGRTGDVRVIH